MRNREPQGEPSDPLLEEVKSLRSWRKEAEGLLREASYFLRPGVVFGDPEGTREKIHALLGEREGTEGK